MEKKQHVTDIVFILSLFCVFAVMALFVVVLGANVYQGISADMAANYNARTSIAYLGEKVRQNDVAGGVDLREVDGGDALVLVQQVEGREYETWIYVSDGMLREVTVAAGTQVHAGDGQEIMELNTLVLGREDGNLIGMEATDADGNVFKSAVSYRSGESGNL